MTGFSVARSRTLIAMSRPRFLTSLPLAVTLKCFVVGPPPVVIGGRLNVSGEFAKVPTFPSPSIAATRQ